MNVPRRLAATAGALALAGTVGALGCTTATASAPGAGTAAAASSDSLPPIVPQPVTEQPGSGPAFRLDPATHIAVLDGDAASAGVGNYLAGFLRPSTGYALPVTEQGGPDAITLNPHGPASLGAEGYTLDSDAGQIRLVAHGAEGLFRGVQTLRQLLPAAVESASKRPGPWTVPAVHIADRPRYSYRGAMLDVGRRFFPVKDVERYIDQAAAYKMNTLHLHLTEDQGWRIAIAAIPSLTTVGASTQSGWTGGTDWYYTADQYRQIVAYAKSRFMTVVPEVDGPGHTTAALASVPDLNCNDQAMPPYSGFGGANLHAYCLSDPQHIANVGKFLTTVMNTLSAMTPGPIIHVGGDEASEVTPSEYSAYVAAVSKAVTGNGKRLMGWHNLADGPIPAGTLLQYWGDDRDRSTVGTSSPSADIKQVQEGVAKGADFVVSPADRSYLDMQYDTSTPFGLHWEGYVPVERAYSWDPTTATAKPDGTDSVIPADRVAGIEAALWSDRAYYGSNALPTSQSQFPDPSVYADFMVYPRLPAVAEIGWSPLSTHDWNTFKLRLAAQGPRWDAAGIGYYRAPGVPWPSGS